MLNENVLVVGACCSFGAILIGNILNEYNGVILTEHKNKQCLKGLCRVV